MYKLVYTPDGIALGDRDVWSWCEAMLHQHDKNQDVELPISQIDIFTVFRAVACREGVQEYVGLVIDGVVTYVNKYGAYHGQHPEPPSSEAAMVVVEYAMKKRKYEMTVYPWADISPEDKAAIDARIRSFAVRREQMGIKIEAIKFLRHHVDLSLTEAKRYVDDAFDAYAKALMEEDCSNDMVEAHVRAMWDANRIEAIKWVKNRYNMTLREAKERTEDIVWREGVPQSDYEREEDEE